MLNRLLFLLFLRCPLCSFGQVDTSLKRELDSIYVLDQKYRTYLSEVRTDKVLRDSLIAAFKIQENELSDVIYQHMSAIDVSNLVRVEQLIKTYGYPGKTLVGEPTNIAAWYVIQHSPKIKEYLPMIQKASKAGELPFTLVAMMEDRQLMQDNKPQAYGTQGACRPLRSNNAMECFIWPIDKPKTVNQRRKQAGFNSGIKGSAKRLEIKYKPLTLEQVKQRYILGD